MSRPPNPEISPLRASCRAGTPLIAFAPWSVQFKKQTKSMDHLPFSNSQMAVAKTTRSLLMRRTTQHGEDNTMQCSVHAERATDSEAELSPNFGDSTKGGGGSLG